MAIAVISRHLRICGRVQGVGFRAFVKHHAGRLGLSGFVRNRTDDTVEVVVTGESAQMLALIDLCREGPPAARVDEVAISEAPEFEGNGFTHLPTV